MTGFNNNGKFVPSTPKTYEVKYVEETQFAAKFLKSAKEVFNR